MVAGRPGPRQRFDQRLFRYGQAALAHGSWRPVVRLWRENPPAANDIQPGIMVAQKDAEVDRAHLWLGLVAHDQTGTSVEVTVTLTDEQDPEAAPRTEQVELHWFDISSEAPTTGWAPGTRFFHTHLTIAGLVPDRWYRARARATEPELEAALGLEPTVTCRVRTLPRRLEVGRQLSVFTASCYDIDTDIDDNIGRAYQNAFAEYRPDRDPHPDLSWFTGDAVYADAPWWLYGTMARFTPRTYGLLEYWSAWGKQRRDGMRALLTNGPNWFLPDDHEFWNNWPHATVLARHSYRNRVRAAGGMLGRWLNDRFNPVGVDQVGAPRDPAVAPSRNRAAQNYLPVHPDEWDQWSRAAFDLFGSFQTRSVRDRETGRITYGERDDPDADGNPRDPRRPPRDTPLYEVHRPLNQVLQTIEIDPVHVALLDTRTRRVRKFHHPLHSNFVDQEYLTELLDFAERAPILFLVLAQPVLRLPVGCTVNGHQPDKRRQDRGMEDYCHQYQRFWTGLMQARRGRPTITVGGDIHRSYVGHAPALSLVEVVASPMSLVTGQAFLNGLRTRKRKLLHRPDEADPYATGAAVVEDVSALFVGPDPDAPPAPELPDDPGLRRAVSVAHLPYADEGDPGFATMLIRREGETLVRLDVALHPRDPVAQGEFGLTRRVGFDLHTDRTGPGSVVERASGWPVPT